RSTTGPPSLSSKSVGLLSATELAQKHDVNGQRDKRRKKEDPENRSNSILNRFGKPQGERRCPAWFGAAKGDIAGKLFRTFMLFGDSIRDSPIPGSISSVQKCSEGGKNRNRNPKHKQ